MNIDVQILEQELVRDEDNVLVVYDDATGQPLRAGMTIQGNPTLGVGTNLVVGITNDESMYLLGNRIALAAGELDEQLPWWENLDSIRQRALLNMCFNMGISKLLGFVHFLADLQAGNWAQAGQDMQASAWWNEVGQRAVRLQYMIVNGTVQPGAV